MLAWLLLLALVALLVYGRYVHRCWEQNDYEM